MERTFMDIIWKPCYSTARFSPFSFHVSNVSFSLWKDPQSHVQCNYLKIFSNLLYWNIFFPFYNGIRKLLDWFFPVNGCWVNKLSRQMKLQNYWNNFWSKPAWEASVNNDLSCQSCNHFHKCCLWFLWQISHLMILPAQGHICRLVFTAVLI